MSEIRAYNGKKTTKSTCKKKPKSNKTTKTMLNILIFIIGIGLWCTIVYYGYTYAKGYIDSSINNVWKQNAVNIEKLNEQIQMLNIEIEELKNNIENTDKMILNTSEVEGEIDRKLNQLNGILENLDGSLKDLEEASNDKN